MNKIRKLIARTIRNLIREYEAGGFELAKQKYGYISDSCVLIKPSVNTCPRKIYLYENTHIYENAMFIISPKGETGKFIMKEKSGAAQGLTVVTNAHSIHPSIGQYHMDKRIDRVEDEDKDIVVHEDVWIGANVTLLPGAECGRGSIIAAGTVVRKKIPPYAIAMGNPARIVGFVLKPEEVIMHEEKLYTEQERLNIGELENNYNKYYKNKKDEIRKFLLSSL